VFTGEIRCVRTLDIFYKSLYDMFTFCQVNVSKFEQSKKTVKNAIFWFNGIVSQCFHWLTISGNLPGIPVF
jgi:hypothetical protein